MSDKDRRKKDGHDKSHERQAMRRGKEFQRRKHHVQRQDTHDEVDIVKYKSGSPGDRTTARGAR